MKKYLLFYISAFVCLAQTALAQPFNSNTKEQKQVPWTFPDKLVKPASAHIITAHIPDIKKPFVVSLNYSEEVVNKARAQCAAQKSTLILSAERTSNFAANLKWETKNAFKVSGFNIERSLADTFHFVTINFEAASKSSRSKKNYQLPDHNDYSGASFYRLKQINTDTGYLYSNTVFVKGFDDALLSVFPSPASNKIWINFTAKQSGDAVIMLYDASGKTMQRQVLNCTKDMLIKKDLDVSPLPAGIYQVQIFMPDNTLLTGKFAKE